MTIAGGNGRIDDAIGLGAGGATRAGTAIPAAMRLAMGVLLACLGLLLLGARPVRADPFDTYQLLMWQERTPVQLDGLKRLGFTGSKLRATGGTIDPAELAAHLQSGLPWFLENIATDFYAPYHRYQPGKSVTALFDAAKARYRANPADTSVFIREPGLSDPVWQHAIAERLTRIATEQARYHPLYFNLADEAGIGDLAAAWDADLAPTSLAGMRDWLQTQYPSLAALNAEWDTHYTAWDQVQPMLTDAALRRTDDNFAPWGDFKAWMDVAFSRAVRFGTDALHRADPAAHSALEGGQLPGWGGYDYGQLARAVDVFEIYDEAENVLLARAANPALIVLRTSFGPGDAAEAWRNLLLGGRGTIVWDEGDDVVGPDGTALPRGTELARTVASIRAVAPTIFRSQPDPDPVAVVVSQASFRLRWLMDRRSGAPWADRSAGREYEDNAWRAARRETVARLSALGIVPHILFSPALEAGALERDGARVLFLPDATALSDAEVAAIRAFAARGGTVLADTEPGLFDAHLRRRAAPPLADVAPVSEAVMRRGGVADSGALDALADRLAAAGVAPRATLRRPDGARATGIQVHWFRDGDRSILSIQAAAPNTAPPAITVEFPAPRARENLRDGWRDGARARFDVPLDAAEPTILSLSPP